MKRTVPEFLACYAASGLEKTSATQSERGDRRVAETSDQLLQKFAAEQGGREPTDAAELARWLIRRGSLTRYQAKQLIAAKRVALRVGDLLIREPLERPPFIGWWSAIAEDGSPVRLFQGPASEGFASEGSASGSFERYRRHAALKSPHLQKLEPPLSLESRKPGAPKPGAAAEPGRMLYVTRLAAGATAAETLPKTGFSPLRVVQIGRQLCSALTAAHEQGLQIEIIDPTRVWLAESGAAILLRDPLADPRSGEGGWFAPPELRGLYLAPERSAAGREPDAASDLYALGCLLFHLRFGQPPFPATTSAELAEQHAHDFPEAVRKALAAPEAGEPLLRVIGHAMGKNRAARFTTAAQMETALAAVEAHLAKHAPPSPPQTAPNKPVAAKPAAAKPVAATKPAAAATPPAAAKPAAPVAPPVSKKPPVAEEPPVAAAPEIPTAAAPPIAPATLPEADSPEAESPEPEAPETVAAVSPAAVAPPVAAARPAGTPVVSAPAAAPVPAGPRRSGGKRRKKNQMGTLIVGGLGFLVMFLVILLLVQRPGGQSDPQQAERTTRPPLPPPRTATPAASTPAGTAGSAENGVTLSDSTEILWASPATGQSPELSLLPPGAAMVVSFRPARLRSTEAGRQLAQVLSPELSEGLEKLESRIGVPLDRVERLTLAIEGAGGGATQASLAVLLAQPVALETLREGWEAEAVQTPGGQTVYAGEEADGDVFYVPPSEQAQVRRFAVGSIEQIERVAEIEGGPIPLPRSHEQLWRGIGADPDLAVLVSPNFLFADGRQMLEQYAPAITSPLRRLLVPDATALAIRMDLEPQWYAEMRLAPGGSISPTALAKNVEEAVAKLPRDAEQFLLTSAPHPSWRALALRLPAMMRAVEGATRSGVADGNAVVNLYLPSEAAPNVLLGAWLASNTSTDGSVNLAANSTAAPGGGTPGGGIPGGGTPPAGPKTVDEMLDLPLTVRFDQESLEFAADTIREQFNASLPAGSSELKIVLMGTHLQLAGITQNQQIRDFNHSNAPLKTVLDDLVQRANPDKTATRLDQDAQKLVWALGPDPDDPSSRVVLITIREKALADYELPPQFKPANP